jgi:hypothetical protein
LSCLAVNGAESAVGRDRRNFVNLIGNVFVDVLGSVDESGVVVGVRGTVESLALFINIVIGGVYVGERPAAVFPWAVPAIGDALEPDPKAYFVVAGSFAQASLTPQARLTIRRSSTGSLERCRQLSSGSSLSRTPLIKAGKWSHGGHRTRQHLASQAVTPER